MRIKQSATDVRRRAAKLYLGDSPPISDATDALAPLELSWWLTKSQNESPDSARQRAGLQLYLEVGAKTDRPIPANSFPAIMDCDGGVLRPDKAIVKALYEQGLVSDAKLGAQVIFTLTAKGEAFRNAED